MEGDGDDGLQKLWDMYYRCPHPTYIQFLQATRSVMNAIPSTTMPCRAPRTPYDKVPNEGLSQEDATTTAATCSSTLSSCNLADDISNTTDITMLPTQHNCHADLQVALDKHWDDVLCLLRTQTPTN